MTVVNWISEYRAMNLNKEKEVTRAARPSLRSQQERQQHPMYTGFRPRIAVIMGPCANSVEGHRNTTNINK